MLTSRVKIIVSTVFRMRENIFENIYNAEAKKINDTGVKKAAEKHQVLHIQKLTTAEKNVFSF